jgi:hypothetical protein
LARSWEERLAALNQQPRRWLALLALLLAIQITPTWYPTPDGCCYLSIARSIASGNGPANLGSSQLYYAPGYPLLISPAFLLSDRPFLFLSMAQWILAVFFMLGVYRWTHRLIPAAALLVTALATVNVELWCLYRRTLSEMAFMAVLVWLVNVLNDVLDGPSSRLASLRILLASVLLAGLVSIRQAGIVFAAGFGVAQFFEASRGKISWMHAATASLAVGLPAVLTFVAIAQHDRNMAATSQSVTYMDHVLHPESDRIEQMLEGLRLRMSEIGRIMIPGMYKSYSHRGEWLNINMAIYVPWFGLMLLGWSRLVRRSQDVFALTIPFYLALYIVWPFDQATRFFVPMIPLLMTCLWLVVEPMKEYRLRILAGMLALHGAVAIGYWVAVDAPRARNDHAHWAAIEQLASAIHGRESSVQTVQIRENPALMLQFALDRRVQEAQEDRAIPADVDYIIMPGDSAGLGDFTVQFTAGDFQLVRRRSAP